jgi:hypothetical protein
LKFLYNPKDIGRPPKCHVCLHSKLFMADLWFWFWFQYMMTLIH